MSLSGQQTAAKHTVLKGEQSPRSLKIIKLHLLKFIDWIQKRKTEFQKIRYWTFQKYSRKLLNSITHIVAPKETLFGLATKYNVKAEAIQNANTSVLSNGLQVGQQLIIPQEAKVETTSSKNTHLVQPKESLFSIARLYNVSVEDLDKANAAFWKMDYRSDRKLLYQIKRKH